MNHKFTSFVLALILFAVIAMTIEANPTSSCPYNKRNQGSLSKRHNVESPTCPCALAQATFAKNVSGITIYAQTECGQTTISGFLTGLNDPSKNNYTFFIVDKCGKVIRDLTETLGAKIADDGSTQFTVKANDINLNCDKDGILNTFCTTPKPTKNYTSYYKRDGQGSDMRINQNGAGYALANIGSI